MLSGPELLPAGGVDSVTSLVVLLHGYGSNGDDLIGIAREWKRDLPQTAFVSPHAPTTLPNMHHAFQWFGIWDLTPWQIEQGLRHVTPQVIEFVKAQATRFKLGLDRVVLVGFSQGTMLSLHVGLRDLAGLAGIIGYSGAMISPNTLAVEKNKPMPPVLLVHGMMDHVVPWGASQMAADVIKQQGGTVETMFCPMLAHSIDRDGMSAGIRQVQVWFGKDQP
jgi:phospholipase/carboxylesterase